MLGLQISLFWWRHTFDVPVILMFLVETSIGNATDISCCRVIDELIVRPFQAKEPWTQSIYRILWQHKFKQVWSGKILYSTLWKNMPTFCFQPTQFIIYCCTNLYLCIYDWIEFQKHILQNSSPDIKLTFIKQ